MTKHQPNINNEKDNFINKELEQVARNKKSYTGQYLAEILKKDKGE